MKTKPAPKSPRVIALVPDQNGGINSLFRQLKQHQGPQDDTGLDIFASTDKKAWRILRFPGRVAMFAKATASARYDLAHINLSTGGSALRKVIYAAVCRLCRLPYVIHVHGGSYREFYAALGWPFRAAVRTMFVKAARVIVLGAVWRDFIVDEIGVDPARAVILANAVRGPDTLDESLRPGVPHLLFLGLIGPPKGIPELLEALASEKVRALDWSATLAGNGAVEELRKDVIATGLEARISVPGWIDLEEAQSLLARSNVLLLPSHVENLPLSMLEGMAFGLCPIVTPVGAVAEVIRHEENGLIVPVNNAEALGAALARVLGDEPLRARLGEQARRDFEAHYDMRNYRSKLDAVYLDVCGD